MQPHRSTAHTVPGWARAVMVVGAALASSAMLWAATLPGGNLALTLVAAAGVIAVSLAAVPGGVEGVRGRRFPWFILVTVACVMCCVVVSASSVPLRWGASTVAADLASASRSGACPSVTGIYRVVDCTPIDGGTLYFIDGAGIDSPAGFALLHSAPDARRVEADGISVMLWPIEGEVYAFRIDYSSLDDAS